MNWTIDHKTGTYHSNFPTPTGNPADPTLTAHGVRQSQELAAHVTSEGFAPRPWRIYSSPFYRCIQTIRPSVEALKTKKKQQQQRGSASPASNDDGSDFDIRVENGLGYEKTSLLNRPLSYCGID
jgi:transcription factor C subunit 7